MRKILFTMCCLMMALATQAQDDLSLDDDMFGGDQELGFDDGYVMGGEKHSVTTNSFWCNWFVQGAVTFAVFWSDEQGDLPNGLTYSFRNNISMSFAIGKWFTPCIGLRTKMNGFWGRTVYSGSRSANFTNYWTLHEQVLVNMSNMLYGYNPERLYSCIPYMGVGLGRSTSYHHGGMGCSFGLLNSFRVCKRISVNLDVNYNIYEPDFDGVVSDTYEDKHDRMLNFELGVTYNIGRTSWKRSPDVEAMRIMQMTETDALNAQIRDLQIENDYLRQEIKEKEGKK